MIKLDIKCKLHEMGKTRYWLCRQLGTSWQNLNKMLNNETHSIRYDTIETLCQLFECTPNDLFLFDEKPYEGFPLKTESFSVVSKPEKEE